VLFGRYAALFAGRGYDVTLLTPPALAPLMRGLPQVEEVIDDPAALKNDKRRMVWFPLQSVMGILPLTPQTVPDQGAYLTADPAQAAMWAQRLAGEGRKVGIAWRDAFGGDAAPVTALAPLAAADGVRLIALQTGAAAEAAATFGTRLERPLTSAPANAQMLLDLAAVIANLDVVVSVDALPAYIAAAMGKRVMLALPTVPDWRWLLERTDSPWFPTMRLFRQTERDDWNPVFADIADALHKRET
jgi:ADP-heptose:LPS heptosyltransferase